MVRGLKGIERLRREETKRERQIKRERLRY